jgi:lactoylglutathione lyase
MAGKKKSKKDQKSAKKAATAARKAAPKAAKKTVKKPVARRKPARRAVTSRQQPESLRLRSAGPGFTVNDVQKSLAFYRDVLGFTVKDRWEQDGALRGVELVAGSVTFWLGQDDWKKGRDRVKGQGFRMYCATAQDIDALAQRVKACGGALVEEPKDQPWGGRACAVVDPDGFTITFATEL